MNEEDDEEDKISEEMFDGLYASALAGAYEEKEGDSFISGWQKIKGNMAEELDRQKHFVTFTGGHGSVISFDRETTKDQPHEQQRLADDLGFEHIDSAYHQGTRAPYRVSGAGFNPDDLYQDAA